MRYVRDQTGRFAERPHYQPKELDILFERLVGDFLKSRHGKVEFPISTDDLTVMIERDTHDLDTFADLTEYGRGVEGVTEFRPGRKPIVRISQNLANADNRENRQRTTMTHEYGHVHLHSPLFALRELEPSLFERKQKDEVIACKRDTMISASQTDWMEWQAGYACGAILMPASYVGLALKEYRTEAGIYGPVPPAAPHGNAMIAQVVKKFQVSQDAARVRLSVLGFLGAVQVTGSLPL